MVTPRSNRKTADRLGLDATTSDPFAVLVARERVDPVQALASAVAAIEHARPTFHADAACRGSGLDFTTKNAAQVRACLSICGTCPVRLECRDWADETGDQHAILGGEDAPARRARWRASGLRNAAGRLPAREETS